MSIIQERIEKVETAKEAVRTHCMCAEFSEDDDYYRVVFPTGFRIDGIRASKDVGHARALNLMLDTMERTWTESQL